MKKTTKRRRSFRQLNQFDRDRIEALLEAGHQQNEIASIIGFSESCISRERKRERKNGCYEARTAQNKARVKRLGSKYQGMKIEEHPNLKRRIIQGLINKRSPDEIAGRMRRDKLKTTVNTKAIYRWLYSSYGQRYCKYLCTRRYRRKKQKKKTKREMIPNRISLKQRPLGGIHAEGDLFVSPTKTGAQRSGAIVCVPRTKLMAGMMIFNKKPASMTEAVRRIRGKIKVDDLTLDNGIENRDHEKFGLPTYFADPHSPWQKPHVENSIGLLRRWFIPKKTDLRNVPEKDLQRYLHIINSKFRKSLGYRSAYEVSLENGIIQKIPAQGEEN